MGSESIKRRDLFKKIIGIPSKETVEPGIFEEGKWDEGPDLLFEKYARKSLPARQYSEVVAVPGTGTELNRVGNVTSGLAAYTDAWDKWQAAHLLRRAGFGVKKADLEALLAMTMSDAVDNLFTLSPPSSPSPTPLNHYQNTLPDSGGITLGNSWTSNNLTYVNSNDGSNNSYRLQSLAGWSWGLCINEGTSIREKMTHFWYHFIPVNFSDISDLQGNGATMGNDYMNLLRNNALGNFKTLIKAIAKTPAMLVYLGGQSSTASVPNENFGRELMELFTMGKLPTQNYTESDIIAASKVFSGWRVPSGGFVSAYPFAPGFNSAYHNQGNKVFSANFGNTTITNQSGANGANEFDIFFDMLFTQQQTTVARYVCRRLYRYFIYYDIDANIETNVIVPLANLLVSSNWEMAPVVKTLFKSEHFYDVANKGVMIKSPLDLMAGTLRTLNMPTTAATGANQVVYQYAIWNYFQNFGNNYLEQGIGLVPNVSGWKAYYQEPAYYQNWINSNSIQRRSSLLTAFVSGFTPSTGNIQIKFDPIAFVQQFPNATIQDPDLLIEAIVPYLLTVDLPASYKSDTKIQTLLNGQVTNSYWTTAWNNYTGAPTNTSYINTVKSRLNSLFTTFLQLAEFQLM